MKSLYSQSCQYFYPPLNNLTVHDDGHNFCVIQIYTLDTTTEWSCYNCCMIQIQLLQDRMSETYM